MPPTNAELLARDCSSLVHSLHNRSAQQSGHVWVRGEGAVLTDADGKEYLDGIARRLVTSGTRVRVRVESAAIVARAILEIAREEHADVVALATHGRSGIARLMLGSVADKVVQHSRVPVLVYR